MTLFDPLRLAQYYADIKYRRKFPRDPNSKTPLILWIIIIAIALYIIFIRGCGPI